MVSASLFGLILEGLAAADSQFDILLTVLGVSAGVVLVIVAARLISDHAFDPKEYEEADFTKLVLILGILTVHSFPEGVGVSFAELNFAGGLDFGPFIIPVLAVFMTVEADTPTLEVGEEANTR